MALAGLWETWRSRLSGERVRSFAIVTTEPNELCAQIHNRMPVVLAPEAWPAWLGEQPADEEHLKALLAPYPSEEMVCWPNASPSSPQIPLDSLPQVDAAGTSNSTNVRLTRQKS